MRHICSPTAYFRFYARRIVNANSFKRYSRYSLAYRTCKLCRKRVFTRQNIVFSDGKENGNKEGFARRLNPRIYEYTKLCEHAKKLMFLVSARVYVFKYSLSV